MNSERQIKKKKVKDNNKSERSTRAQQRRTALNFEAVREATFLSEQIPSEGYFLQK